jgi:hypothetical protein
MTGASPFAWAFISGIEANSTGTGRFMQHLQTAVIKRGKFDGTILYCPSGQTIAPHMLNMLTGIPHLVAFHPQMLGFRDTLTLFQQRAAAGRVSHLYLLDNSFFCVRSYNHLDHETGPCFRCVGPGQSANATRQGCIPWPARDPFATSFIDGLSELVRAGRVHLFAQNRGQIDIARRHFGADIAISYAGLWCADWTIYADAFATAQRAEGDASTEPPAYDVVYHGSRDLAKGIGWVLAVAARTPELKYLVPIDRGAVNVNAPPNVIVTAMRWESGLHDAVRTARLVLAPSLWSSPCEGALIKNIVIARAPAVVDVPSAFSAEIPENVVLRLPQSPDQAAAAVREAVAKPWRPDPAARSAWVKNFRAFNEAVAGRLLPGGAL